MSGGEGSAGADDSVQWCGGVGGGSGRRAGGEGGVMVGGGTARQALCPLRGLMLAFASSLVSYREPPIRSSDSKMKASVETMMITIIPTEMNLAVLLYDGSSNVW